MTHGLGIIFVLDWSTEIIFTGTDPNKAFQALSG